MKSWIVVPVLALAAALTLGAQHVATRPGAAAQGQEPSSAPLAATTNPASPAVDATRDPDAAQAARATEILDQLAETYPSLKGTSVRIGETPKGEEAVAYYTTGEIVIDRDHTVEIETILAHEIWHVIDWRDNGRLDWGEDLPPANASDYL